MVAVLQSQSADDARVDNDGEADFFLQLRRQLLSHALPVVRAQLDRGRDCCPHATRRLVGQALELVLDRRRLIDSARFDEEPGEVRCFLVEQVRGVRDESLAPVGRDGRVVQHRRHMRIGEELADSLQAPRPLLELPILLGQLEACGAWRRRAFRR